MARRQIGIKLDDTTIKQIERVRGKLTRTAFIEALVLTEIANRLKGHGQGAVLPTASAQGIDPVAHMDGAPPERPQETSASIHPPVISSEPLYRGPKRNATARPKGKL